MTTLLRAAEWPLATFPGGPAVARAAALPLILPRQSTQEYDGDYEITPWYQGRGTTLGLDPTLHYQYFTGSWWLFNFPEAAALTPPLGNPSTPGIPVPLTTAFASVPHPPCETHFPDLEQKAGAVQRSRQPGHGRAGRIEPEGGGT